MSADEKLAQTVEENPHMQDKTEWWKDVVQLYCPSLLQNNKTVCVCVCVFLPGLAGNDKKKVIFELFAVLLLI